MNIDIEHLVIKHKQLKNKHRLTKNSFNKSNFNEKELMHNLRNTFSSRFPIKNDLIKNKNIPLLKITSLGKLKQNSKTRRSKRNKSYT